MRNLLLIVSVFLFGVCLVVGCDYGGDTTDNDPVYCTGDKADDPGCVVVEPTESPPTEDVWVEENMDEAEPPVDLDKACGGFIGRWDCIVIKGMGEGTEIPILITPLEILEYEQVFWVDYLQGVMGLEYSFVCDGYRYPPATTFSGDSLYLYLSDNESILTIEDPHPVSPKMDQTLECTRHPTY